MRWKSVRLQNAEYSHTEDLRELLAGRSRGSHPSHCLKHSLLVMKRKKMTRKTVLQITPTKNHTAVSDTENVSASMWGKTLSVMVSGADRFPIRFYMNADLYTVHSISNHHEFRTNPNLGHNIKATTLHGTNFPHAPLILCTGFLLTKMQLNLLRNHSKEIHTARLSGTLIGTEGLGVILQTNPDFTCIFIPWPF